MCNMTTNCDLKRTSYSASRLIERKYLLVALMVILVCSTSVAQNWVTVGSTGFSNGEAYSTAIAVDRSGSPYVVYMDSLNDNKATVMKYTGGSWVAVGTAGFSVGGTLYTSIAIDGNDIPYVAFSDNARDNKATVMKFDGSNWVTVGSAGFSAGAAKYLTIAIDSNGTPYVAYSDFANNRKATVMKYESGSWIAVGSPSGFSVGKAISICLAVTPGGTPYVIYNDSASASKATVMMYNGSSWASVGGAGFSYGPAYATSIAIDGNGTPYVSYSDLAYGSKPLVKKYNGTAWVSVGNATGISSALANYFTSIAIDGSGTPYVFYADGNSGYAATVLTFNGTSWAALGSPSFSAGGVIGYNHCIAVDQTGSVYVGYADGGNDNKASVMKFGTGVGVANINSTPIESLAVFPVPNNGLFTVTLSSQLNEDARIVLFNMTGEIIKKMTIPTNQHTQVHVDVPTGQYLINACTETGHWMTKIFVEK